MTHWKMIDEVRGRHANAEKIEALKLAIDSFEAEQAVWRNKNRKNEENVRQLGLLTGKIFFVVRIFSRDCGEVVSCKAFGLAKGNPNINGYGMSCVLADSETIKVTAHSDGLKLSTNVRLGNQMTWETDDMCGKEEVTVAVFLTAAQAEAWAEANDNPHSSKRSK